MKKLLFAGLLFTASFAVCLAAHAQSEGPVPTQTLVSVEAKSTPPTSASVLTVSVNDRKAPVTAFTQLRPDGAQVALLIDDGLRQSIGRELENLRHFVITLPPGIEVLIGYMQYGHVVAEQPFTTDHVRAAAAIHSPVGMAGMSASPYLCLSDFVKKWPSAAASAKDPDAAPVHKARFVLMLSNGVDPYNGSTALSNQDSPYVATAIEDAQRAGVAVYSIYFGGTGIGGGSADFSGQGYLSELTQGTGGVNYYQGTGNPVSMAPFLGEFQAAIAETYVATFNTSANGHDRDMVRIKISGPNTKLRTAEEVRVGNQE